MSPSDAAEDVAPYPARKVMLVDQRPEIRQRLAKSILREAPATLITECASGENACGEFLRDLPDVTLVALDLPGISGVETIHRLFQRNPRANIVVLGRDLRCARRDRCLKAGARGYIRETRAQADIFPAIESVALGGTFMDMESAREIAIHGLHPATAELEVLSDREFEVFFMMVHGQNLNSIAKRLSLGYKTIAGYGTRIRGKLGLKSSGDILRFAMTHGLMS